MGEEEEEEDEKLFLALSQCGFCQGIRRRKEEREWEREERGVLSPSFFFLSLSLFLFPLIQSLPSHLSKFLRMIADCAAFIPQTPTQPHIAGGKKRNILFPKNKTGAKKQYQHSARVSRRRRWGRDANIWGTVGGEQVYRILSE